MSRKSATVPTDQLAAAGEQAKHAVADAVAKAADTIGLAHEDGVKDGEGDVKRHVDDAKGQLADAIADGSAAAADLRDEVTSKVNAASDAAASAARSAPAPWVAAALAVAALAAAVILLRGRR
ncbi:MAG TPA: hypothetical protein VMA83_07345 [Solirubrobacteraceae bacterium]|nr:hypothetical protein [Solirubrobacteraceae bacterium]